MTYVKLTCFLVVFVALPAATAPGRIILAQSETSRLRDQLADSSPPHVSLTEVWQAPRAKPFDKFGAIRSNDEKARLDAFASELQSDPDATGCVIVYGRRGGPKNDAKKRADGMKRYLWYYNRTSNKLVSVDHCFAAKVQNELWVVPLGATVPTCTNRR